MISDGWGFIGLVLDYAVIFLFSGCAMLLFLYFWKKGRLNFDEEPKHQMLQRDEAAHESKKS